MNINKILIIVIVIFAVTLSVLGTLLVKRRAASNQMASTNTPATASPVEQGASQQTVLSSTDKQKLQQFAAANPEAAVEGVRSPTPMPPNTVTLTDKSIEPPILTQLTSATLTVVNRTNTSYEVWVQLSGEAPKNTGKKVESGTNVQVELVKNVGKQSFFFAKEGVPADAVKNSYKVDILP